MKSSKTLILAAVLGLACLTALATAEVPAQDKPQFVRNDTGVIDRCIMTTMGQAIEGTKIIKSPAAF